MSSYTETLVRTMSLARRHHDVGYALYIAGQPVTACQSDDMRCGWYNARLGELAASECDTLGYLYESRGF